MLNPGQPSLARDGRRSGAPGPPSFKYFNAAISDADKAIVATTKHSGATEEMEVAAVRSLSPDEITALKLKAGEVKPA